MKVRYLIQEIAEKLDRPIEKKFKDMLLAGKDVELLKLLNKYLSPDEANQVFVFLDQIYRQSVVLIDVSLSELKEDDNQQYLLRVDNKFFESYIEDFNGKLSFFAKGFQSITTVSQAWKITYKPREG